MRKKIQFLLILPILIGLACTNTPELTEYQQLAWDLLSPEAKSRVIHPPYEAKVIYDTVYSGLSAEAGVPAVAVEFNTLDDELVGPLILYFSPDTKEFLGYNLGD